MTLPGSRTLPPQTHLLCISTFCSLVMLGCEPSSPAATPNKEGVPCIGLPEHKANLLDTNHPYIFQGTVNALPSTTSTVLDLFIPSAHAYALEAEHPVANTQVHITYVNAITGERSGEPVSYHATTDARGRFCIVAPRRPEAGELIVLEATHDALKMRQIGLHSFDAHINAMSEAATRHALAYNTRAGAPLTPTQWLNLRTLVDTRTGLLSPVNAASMTSQEELITAIHTLLEADPEVTELLRPK